MSGEASWLIRSERFTLAILSGRPVWTAVESAGVERQLRETDGAVVPAIEKLLEHWSAGLEAGRGLRDSARPVHVSRRHPLSGQGFNLKVTVATQVEPAQLDELAGRLAQLLWPEGGASA